MDEEHHGKETSKRNENQVKVGEMADLDPKLEQQGETSENGEESEQRRKEEARKRKELWEEGHQLGPANGTELKILKTTSQTWARPLTYSTRTKQGIGATVGC